MCRTKTPVADQVECSRCGDVANPTDGWEHGWPLYGRIVVGFPSRITDELARGFAQTEVFDHPTMVGDCGFQGVDMQWSSGYGPLALFNAPPDPPHSFGELPGHRYRLCYECQRAFLRTIGEFFKIEARHADGG